MEFVANIVPMVAQFVFRKIGRHFSYAFHHRRRVSSFDKKVELLKGRRDRVQQKVDAAERNGENVHNDVKTWLIQASNLIDAEFEEVKGLEDKAKNKCFIGLCPNFKVRYQLSKKVETDANDVDQLLQQGVFNEVSYRNVLLPRAMVNPSPKDFEAFDSRKQVFIDIIQAMKDPNVNIIGVYGMAGVGKTTLVEEIIRQVKEDKLFDSVVMAVVTHTPDIQKVQDQIADMLGLKFEEQSMTGRANRLCERLKKEKKVLVVLDDIWGKIKLMDVGIPVGDEHHGCTILVTSRDVNVLSKGMHANISFTMGVLKQEETWDLFKSMAGEGVESPDLKPIATKVAAKCGGLPIAIKALATTLKNEPHFVWEDALRQLNKPSSSNFRGVPAEAYKAIELSYSLLESEEHKQIFLLCSLLGHNAYIDVLLKFASGLRLFHGVSTVEEARNRLLTVVSHLKAACLLLDSYYIQCYDMHDLISDVAISIASKDNHVFVLRNEDVLNDWPDGDTEKISLWNANIGSLPDHLKCPKLTFFSINSKDPLLKVPTNFFREMKFLKVLVFSKMNFPSLPSSISLLSNLRTLCLDECVLGDISLVGELENLEILHLVFSDIEMLPKEIGQLTKLKMLDLSGSKLKRIQSGVFCSLCRLEELHMGNSFVLWEAEQQLNQPSIASLVELKALSCLTVLDVHIPNAHIIPKDFLFERLRRYNIFIGEAWVWDWDWVGVSEYSTTLKLNLQSSFSFLNNGMKALLNKAENLYLDEMKGLEILVHQSEARGYFQKLKNLHIQNGALIQYILKDIDVVSKIEFPQLQSLTLQGLPKLVSFCSENKCSTSISPQEMALFSKKILFPKLEELKLSSIGIERIWFPQGFCTAQNLTILIIECCTNLKHVLSDSMAEHLQQLKYLEISECERIQEIIIKEAFGNKATISFPRLNSLKLKGLQTLIGFCHEDCTVEFPDLKILEIENCPELKEFVYKSTSTNGVLFNEKVAFPKLEKMIVSHLNKVKRIWYKQLHAGSFTNLKELKAEYCDVLLNIFPSFFPEVFQRVERLTVTHCTSLEDVFPLQFQETFEVIGSQLREVELNSLPNLKHVWNKDPDGYISFENLRQVNVWECWSLRTLFPFSIAKGLVKLESLVVHFCGVEEIVSKKIGVDEKILFEFNQLSFLMLWNLPSLKCFYPGMHEMVWPMLKRVKIYECMKMKIFGEGESQIQRPLFQIGKVMPQLEEVSFSSDDIAMISDGEFAADLFYQIKFLWITTYHFDSAVFPFSFLERFYNLEMLELFSCDFKDLSSSSYEDDAGEGKDMITFIEHHPRIKKFKLDGLKDLRHLWNQDSPLHHICSSLESLEVHRCDSLINLSPASLYFHNLTTFDVWKCKEIAVLITSSKARSLERLVTLRIRECEIIREVIVSDEDEATKHEIIFRDLKSLELQCLQSLKVFCSGNYTFRFPSLDQVIVTECPRLKNFCEGALSTPKLKKVQLTGTDYKGRWAGDLNATVELLYKEQVGYRGLTHLKLSEFPELIDVWSTNPQEMLNFSKLEYLEVCDTNNLRYIFNLSMAFSLGRLQQIEIKRCSTLEQVMIEEEGSFTTDNINNIVGIFPRLQSIIVESCPDMTSFYLGSSALECPSLIEIKVADCPNMNNFVSAFPRHEHNEAVTAYFCDKVGFPNLQKITISDLSNVKRIWYNQPQTDSFSKLKELNLKGCDTLLNIFPPFLLEVFQSLEILSVSDCASLEEVFQLQIQPYVVQSELRELSLVRSPKLKHVWNEDPSGNFCFGNLRKVYIWECWSLKAMFPFSIAENLQQLESLTVCGCEIKEIVSKNIGVEREIRFEFNQLSYLQLWTLADLVSFYPGVHTTTWPVLRKMKVHGYGEFKMFGLEQSQIQRPLSLIEKPLFLIEKIIPQLEEVSFNSDEIAMISDGQFATDFFSHVKFLQITHYIPGSATLMFRFLEKFYNLETLELFSSNITELCFYEGDKKDAIMITFPRIKNLTLDFMDNIQYLWKQDSTMDPICASSLECLKVWRCDSLINLSSASSSFRNLTTLEVRQCKRITELITSTNARCLERLVTLTIRDCEIMREVIASDGDEATDHEIIFKELKCLELHCLQNLKAFCSGNCTFKFPSLDQVIVSQCPRMKNFCGGALSAPKLEKVRLTGTDYKGRWAGDLNATVEQLNIQDDATELCAEESSSRDKDINSDAEINTVAANPIAGANLNQATPASPSLST